MVLSAMETYEVHMDRIYIMYKYTVAEWVG